MRICDLIILITAFSCGKESENDDEINERIDDCNFGMEFFLSNEIGKSSTGTTDRSMCPNGITFEYIGYARYYGPTFSPSDPNIIVYGKKELSEDPDIETKLILFDFCTGVETLLDQGEYLGVSKWTKDNWIYYSKNLRSYRMRAEDGISQLVDIPGGIANIKWNNSGNKVAFTRQASLADNYLIIADAKFNPLDTLEGIFTTSFRWGENDQLALIYGGENEIPKGIYIYNNINKTVTLVRKNDPDEIVGLLSWARETNNIFYQSGGNTYQLNVESGVTTDISIDTGMFGPTTISPSGNYILGHYSYNPSIEQCLVQTSYELMMYNLFTNEHKIIDFQR